MIGKSASRLGESPPVEIQASTFCHFGHFFPSRKAADDWIAQHPGTFTLSVADAHALGRRKNQAQYSQVLEQPVKIYCVTITARRRPVDILASRPPSAPGIHDRSGADEQCWPAAYDSPPGTGSM